MGSQLELYIAVQRKDNEDICRNYHLGNVNSQAANGKALSNKARLRIAILDYITQKADLGATCDELEVALGIAHQTCSARCTELKADKLIYEDGGRPTRTGSRAAVLKAVK